MVMFIFIYIYILLAKKILSGHLYVYTHTYVFSNSHTEHVYLDSLMSICQFLILNEMYLYECALKCTSLNHTCHK